MPLSSAAKSLWKHLFIGASPFPRLGKRVRVRFCSPPKQRGCESRRENAPSEKATTRLQRVNIRNRIKDVGLQIGGYKGKSDKA